MYIKYIEEIRIQLFKLFTIKNEYINRLYTY